MPRRTHRHAPQPGNFALNIKCGKIHNFMIVKTPKVRIATCGRSSRWQGYVLGALDGTGGTPFSNLAALIELHAVDRGVLPCCLNLDAVNTIFGESGAQARSAALLTGADDSSESFVASDYQTLQELKDAMNSTDAKYVPIEQIEALMRR